MLLRGFAEFSNDEEDQSAMESYIEQMKGQDMRVEHAKLLTTDVLLVRWYNPKHYRSFKVPK